MPVSPLPKKVVVAVSELLEERLRNRAIRDVEGMSPAEMDELLSRFYKGLGDIRTLPRPTYLLDGWLPRGALTFLTAHGQSGKTLVALAWAACIAAGEQWNHCDVLDPGIVMYLTQEGIGSVGDRLEAYMRQRGWDEDKKRLPNFWLYPNQVPLGTRRENPERGPGWDWLEEQIKEHKPKAVFLDPISDHFNLGDENSNGDASMWISELRSMQGRLGKDSPLVVVLSHVAKTNKAGGDPRGASAWYDGADRAYTLTPVLMAEGSEGGYKSTGNLVAVKLSTEKSKDGGRPKPWFAKAYDHEIEGALGDTTPAVDTVDLDTFKALVVAAEGRTRADRVDETESRMRQQIIELIGRRPGIRKSHITDRADVMPGKSIVKRKIIDDLVFEGIAKDDDGLYLKAQEEPDEL
jgi:hypothetical protein